MPEEVEILKKQIEQLNRKLMIAEHHKSYFLSLVSNEIINPFTSILGLSKLLMEKKSDADEDINKIATLLYTESLFLYHQLTNIFVAARLETGDAALNPSVVNLKRLVNEVVRSFNFYKVEKNVKIVTQFDQQHDYFETDPEFLKVIISNLLSNAVNASEENGQVLLKLQVKNDQLIIEVKDEGEGIAPEKLKEVFDWFKRGDDSINSVNAGSGLGLSVVKGLLDVLSGKIELESSEGKGTKATVIIPKSEIDGCGIGMDEDNLFFEDDTDVEMF